MKSEIENKAEFSTIRYAQVCEDADILLEGLEIAPGDTCLSIASAGDNAFSMLAKNPAKVIAVDLNQAQLFCLELRVAAYRSLNHSEFLELMGSRPSVKRLSYYQKCRNLLSDEAFYFWDNKQSEINKYGLAGVGKFEHYFRLFKQFVLPLIHSKKTVNLLLTKKNQVEREDFYKHCWNSWRWKVLMRLFFSKTLMGRLGRDPEFFRYVDGSFSDHVLAKVKHAFEVLDPSENPYLHWILRGTHGEALPFALRAENFDAIRNHLDRLEWHCLSIEDFIQQCESNHTKIDKFNLSDIFEYMSKENYISALSNLISISNKNSRFLYWNMMVPRSSPDELQDKLISLDALAKELHFQDKAFFYNKLVIEEVR